MSKKVRAFPPMNRAIKRKWLVALRSGKYRRGVGRLKNGRSYCCLGVLCEVMDETPGTNMSECMPDGLTLELAGLGSDTALTLASLNDGHCAASDMPNDVDRPARYRASIGTGFKSIADWIEKYL